MAVGNVATCSHIFVGGFEFSSDFHTLAVNYGSASQDKTTFGSDTRTFKGGLKTAQMSGTAYLNLGSSGVEAVLFSNVATDGTPATVFLHGIDVGSTNLTGHGFASVQSQFNPGPQVGVLIPLAVQMDAAGTLARVTVLEDFRSTAGSTDGLTSGAVNLIHCSTGEKLYGGWHITALTTGLANSISAIIEAASSSGFASSTTRMTFTGRTEKGAQVPTAIEASALSTDQPFIRSVITTTTGTSTGASANGLIWAAIQ